MFCSDLTTKSTWPSIFSGDPLFLPTLPLNSSQISFLLADGFSWTYQRESSGLNIAKQFVGKLSNTTLRIWSWRECPQNSENKLQIEEYPPPPFIIRTIFLAKEEKRLYSFSLPFPLFKVEIFQSSVKLHRGVKIKGLWIHFNSAMVMIKQCIRFLPFGGFRIWLWLFIFSWVGAAAFYPPVNKWLKLPYKSSPLLIGIRLKIDRFQKRSQGHGMAFQTGCQNKCSPEFHL